MASIEKRTGGNGKPEYRARWRDAEGKSRRSRWFQRKYDAERHRATVEADLHRGSYVDMSNATTVAEYARQWGQMRPHRRRTARWFDILTRVHIAPTSLGVRPLVKVRPSEVQAWITGRAQVLSPSTLHVYVGVLRSIFGTAVEDGLIARNPVQRRLSLPKPEHRPVVPLTVAQVGQLADAMPAQYRAMVIAQAGLGLRVGELLSLRMEDVDFLRRMVHVQWQLDDPTLERVPLKTPKSRRDIPLPSVIGETLAQHMAAYPPAADGTIFTPDPTSGAPRRTILYADRVRHHAYQLAIRRAAAQAGLPSVTSHGLRHHFASVLLQAGESVHAVAERLGHTTPELVLRVYGHLMPDREDRTRQAIDMAWTVATRERETGS